MSHSAPFSVLKFAIGSVLLAAGCGTPEAFHDTTLDGGLTGRGGTVGTGTGGVIAATGGMIAGTGGAPGSGGTTATATGGSPGTGGTTSSGGAPATGGRGTGGATATGGMTATGGRGTGGATATGGMTATGGRGTGGAGTGGMPTGVLFMDDFEGGAGKWIAQPAGDWSIVTDGSMVYKEGAAPSNTWREAAAGNTAWTNVIVEARVKVLAFNGSSSSYLAGVCARVRDATNRYCMALRSDGKVAIRKTLAGSGTSGPAANVTNGVALNTWYTVRIQVVGSAITGTVLLNGTQVGVATDSDSSVANGGIELGTQNATAVFDDVRVTTP